MSTDSDNNRGYTLEMHNIMATQDPVWFEKYNDFIHATYTGERTLDRKTKELIQITVEAALKADMEQIQAHVKVALQCGVAPMGALACRRGLQALSAEMGW